MSKIRAKICGLKTKEAVAAATQNGASFLGFIFCDKSPRYITPLEAGKISKNTNIPKVAVVVDATDRLLTDIIQHLDPHYIQLHGNETVERAKAIKDKFRIALIRSVTPNHYPDSKLYDYLLVDNPKGGGSGEQFDYANFTPPLAEYFLSGGLTPENVTEAIKATGAKMVDISSGVESAKGVKDLQKIKEFLKALNDF